MAIDTQMLVGAGFLGVIVLVVAMQGKEGDPDVVMGESAQDHPNSEVDDRLDDVWNIRSRFDSANKGVLTIEQLDTFENEVNVLNGLAQNMFARRKPFTFFNDKEKKKDFDHNLAELLKGITDRRTLLKKEKKAIVEDKVPDNAGVPKKTKNQVDLDHFFQEGSAEDWPAVSSSFGQADEQSKLIEDFAAPKKGVNPTDDKRNSAFQEAADPLNDIDNQNEGKAKRAADDDDDGFAKKSAPDKVIPNEPRGSEKLNEDPKADFNSVPDPPKSVPPSKPIKPEPNPPQEKQVLDKFPPPVANPAFNQTDEVLLGGEMANEAEKQDVLDKSRAAEDDPDAQAEKDKKIQQTEADSLETASNLQFHSILQTYSEQLHKLNRKAQSASGITQRDLQTIKSYVNYVKMANPTTAKQIKLKAEALHSAELILVHAISKVVPRPVREGGRTEEGLRTPPAKKTKNRRRIMGSRTRVV